MLHMIAMLSVAAAVAVFVVYMVLYDKNAPKNQSFRAIGS